MAECGFLGYHATLKGAKNGPHPPRSFGISDGRFQAKKRRAKKKAREKTGKRGSDPLLHQATTCKWPIQVRCFGREKEGGIGSGRELAVLKTETHIDSECRSPQRRLDRPDGCHDSLRDMRGKSLLGLELTSGGKASLQPWSSRRR